MTTALLCASHSPLLHHYLQEPPDWEELQSTYLETESFVTEFAPQLIVLFGTHSSAGAPYQLTHHSRFIADPGGYAGTANAPIAIARALAQAATAVLPTGACTLHDELTLDHRCSQTLGDLAGGIGAYPTITCAIATQSAEFATSHALGTALGTAAASLNLRVLFIASGGLSHEPPPPGTDPRDTALAIAREEYTAVHMRLHPDIDEAALLAMETGELETFHGWDPAMLVAEAGTGMLDLHAWIAATAAHLAAGGAAPIAQYYSPSVELGVAFAVMHGH